MNFVLRLLSPILLKLVARYGLHLPGLDSGRVGRSARKLGSALVLGALALVLFATGLIVGLIDVALQYERNGDLSWNPILWVSLSVFIVGTVCGVMARAMMPGVHDFMPFGSRRTAGATGASKVKGEVTRPPRRPEYAH